MKGAFGMHHPLRGLQKLQALVHGLGEERQARHGGRRRLLQDVGEGFLEIVGIALDDRRLREAALQELAEFGAVFDEDQPILRHAAPDQGIGHRTRAGAELDDGAWNARIHVGRHGPGQDLAGRGDGADDEGPLEPGAQEARFILETILLEGDFPGRGPLKRLKH